MAQEEKVPLKLQRNTPEWFAEWNELAPLLEQRKSDPNSAVTQEIIRSLVRLGLVVDK